MLQLGYDEYVTQGGDWGSIITRSMDILYPDHVKASHINLLLAGGPPTFKKNPILALQHAVTPYTEHEKAGFERTQWFNSEGRGYNLLQSTKPQTLAYALNDSPVALLAWIYEKLHDWTDSYPWTDEEILEWISIYQFSRNGPGAAHNIYYEVNHTTPGPGKVTMKDLQAYVPHVKLGVALNHKELFVPPLSWVRALGEVVFESTNSSGGHFYATEKPELLAKDLRTMFGKGGGASNVVKGKSGYDDDRPRL
ncbi:epoxide hydrolase [Phlyctema vagabunda]|uniref:Epoxide hydrolase n=1 Tax=Phlyctema vagabunda TaxID=108571 RepID=A0ABR4PNV3_9HELO